MKQTNKSLSNKKTPETKAITVKRTFEEKKDSLLYNTKNMYSADVLLQMLFETPKSSIYTQEYKKKLNEVLVAFEFDTHFALWQTTSSQYRSLIGEFCKQIIKEYDCQTPSEKALAEIMAGAFVRQLRCATRLEESIEAGSLLPGATAFMSVIGKELDRATRTFLSALSTLKQIKCSSISLNIKAPTSFIAQNQQINVGNNGGFGKK